MKSIPCETCGATTYMLGTKRCDGCYEVEKRLPAYLENIKGRAFARDILVKHVGSRAKDEEAAQRFDHDNLQDDAKRVRELLGSLVRDTSGAAVMATPHFFLALSLIEQCALNLELASYHQAQAQAQAQANAGRRQ